MQLSDLWIAQVRTLDGKRLGRVHDVHAEGGRIVALVCGPGSLLERLTAKDMGRRIPWESVRKISDGEIIVTDDPPRRAPGKSASGARSRQRTRRPSGPRSKR